MILIIILIHIILHFSNCKCKSLLFSEKPITNDEQRKVRIRQVKYVGKVNHVWIGLEDEPDADTLVNAKKKGPFKPDIGDLLYLQIDSTKAFIYLKNYP